MSEDLTRHIAESDDPLQMLMRHYVSDYHRDEPGQGCSLVALAAGAARHDDPVLRTFFSSIVSNYVALLTTLVPVQDPIAKRSAAITALAEIDGGINGEHLLSERPELHESRGEEGLLNIDAVVEAYWTLHQLHRSAWSQELDLRPLSETY